MAPRAAIFGCAGLRLSAAERAFFTDADPWGFILFARNIDSPDQARALTDELRACVGRAAPVLVDQEGGRVARLRPPHWRAWRDVRAMISGLAVAAAAEALRLRYRLIAAELRGVGVDVNCAPLLDVAQPGGAAFLRDRALGEDAATVARLGRAVRDGLEAGGVAPVIKHIPGHGRGDADSHLRLPVARADRAALDAVDFAAFRPHADAAMAMSAHVLYPALDPDACATFSPIVVEAIRRDIGFDGLLITDDIEMGALAGAMDARAARALAAGCDVVLHCSADMAGMQAVAAAAPPLCGRSLARAEAAMARRDPEPLDVAQAERALAALTGGLADA